MSFGCLGGELRSAAQRMRSRRRLSRGELRRVWIVARNAILPCDRSCITLPITADPAMRARFPIAVRRPMTTATQPRAFGKFQLMPIAGLEHLQIVFVMTIETEIVPVVTAVPHHNV